MSNVRKICTEYNNMCLTPWQHDLQRKKKATAELKNAVDKAAKVVAAATEHVRLQAEKANDAKDQVVKREQLRVILLATLQHMKAARKPDVPGANAIVNSATRVCQQVAARLRAQKVVETMTKGVETPSEDEEFTAVKEFLHQVVWLPLHKRPKANGQTSCKNNHNIQVFEDATESSGLQQETPVKAHTKFHAWLLKLAKSLDNMFERSHLAAKKHSTDELLEHVDDLLSHVQNRCSAFNRDSLDNWALSEAFRSHKGPLMELLNLKLKAFNKLNATQRQEHLTSLNDATLKDSIETTRKDILEEQLRELLKLRLEFVKDVSPLVKRRDVIQEFHSILNPLLQQKNNTPDNVYYAFDGSSALKHQYFQKYFQNHPQLNLTGALLHCFTHYTAAEKQRVHHLLGSKTQVEFHKEPVFNEEDNQWYWPCRIPKFCGEEDLNGHLSLDLTDFPNNNPKGNHTHQNSHDLEWENGFQVESRLFSYPKAPTYTVAEIEAFLKRKDDTYTRAKMKKFLEGAEYDFAGKGMGEEPNESELEQLVANNTTNDLRTRFKTSFKGEVPTHVLLSSDFDNTVVHFVQESLENVSQMGELTKLGHYLVENDIPFVINTARAKSEAFKDYVHETFPSVIEIYFGSAENLGKSKPQAETKMSVVKNIYPGRNHIDDNHTVHGMGGILYDCESNVCTSPRSHSIVTLFLNGTVGSGKTHICRSLATQASEEEEGNTFVAPVSMSEFFSLSENERNGKSSLVVLCDGPDQTAPTPTTLDRVRVDVDVALLKVHDSTGQQQKNGCVPDVCITLDGKSKAQKLTHSLGCMAAVLGRAHHETVSLSSKVTPEQSDKDGTTSVTPEPFEKQGTSGMDMCKLINYAWLMYGKDEALVSKFFEDNGQRAVFTSIGDLRFVTVKYKEGSQRFYADWTKQSRGGTYILDTTDAHSKWKLARSVMAPTREMMHNQHAAYDQYSYGSTLHENFVQRLAKDDEVSPTLTQKMDGSLFNLGCFVGEMATLLHENGMKDSALHRFQRQLITESHNTSDGKYTFMMGSNGVFTIDDEETWATVITSFACSMNIRVTSLDDAWKQVVQKLCKREIKFIRTHPLKERFEKEPMITLTYEGILQSRQSAGGGPTHSELATSDRKGEAFLHAICYGETGMIPHHVFSEHLHNCKIPEPLFWTKCSKQKMYQLLSDVTRVSANYGYTFEQFLETHPPSNHGWTPESPSRPAAEGFMINDDTNGQGDWFIAKFKSILWYAFHNPTEANLSDLLSIARLEALSTKEPMQRFGACTDINRLDDELQLQLDPLTQLLDDSVDSVAKEKLVPRLFTWLDSDKTLLDNLQLDEQSAKKVYSEYSEYVMKMPELKTLKTLKAAVEDPEQCIRKFIQNPSVRKSGTGAASKLGERKLDARESRKYTNDVRRFDLKVIFGEQEYRPDREKILAQVYNCVGLPPLLNLRETLERKQTEEKKAIEQRRGWKLKPEEKMTLQDTANLGLLKRSADTMKAAFSEERAKDGDYFSHDEHERSYSKLYLHLLYLKWRF